ncbi:MAG: flagellar hook-associated protein FlgK, partial [Rhizobiales bacterium]|nr:flagellar hook-associated protein FlgK [Hyphomicrobiales bacterium]
DDGAPNLSDIDAVSATTTVTGFSGGSAELPFFTDAATTYSGFINSVGPQRLGFAGRITVNDALLADPSLLVIYQAGTSIGDPTRPNFIYDQLTGASNTYFSETGIGSAASPFIGPIPAFLRQLISQQGENAVNAIDLARGQDVVVNALKQRMTETSSVNIDEELARLLQLQTAYAANARVLSTVRDMLESLLRL